MSGDANTTPQPQTATTSPQPQQPESAITSWEPLSPLARRILGVLVEKQKTSKTADSYPLSLNSLVTGCNQKSNRDPVLELDEVEVEEGIDALQERGLVTRITGGRVDRFRHELYSNWTSNGAELAVIAELLLRGPQTKGDLRIRASRMAAIESLDALDEVLKPLLERQLVTYLSDPERRGALISHGFHLPEELSRLKSQSATAASLSSDFDPPSAARSSATPALEAKLTAALAEVDSLKTRVGVLESQLAEVRKQLGLPVA